MIPDFDINNCTFFECNEHSENHSYPEIISQLKHKDGILMSEAGIPCLADPGAEIVRMCHKANIAVKPLSGPGSIYMALAASGLNGQQFTFHGYLPARDKNALHSKLKQMASDVLQRRYTQIFIETPYRNKALFLELLAVLPANILLTVASDITSESEFISTRSIAEWKQMNYEPGKVPVVFCLGI
jgi:16S rRNA (cytidine1402-2'-O)-methyltransferase